MSEGKLSLVSSDRSPFYLIVSIQSSCRGSRRRWPSSWPTCRRTWGWATVTTPWCPTRSWETARPTFCPRRTLWDWEESASSTPRASTSPTLRTRVLTEALWFLLHFGCLKVDGNYTHKCHAAIWNPLFCFCALSLSSWASGLTPEPWQRRSHTARLVYCSKCSLSIVISIYIRWIQFKVCTYCAVARLLTFKSVLKQSPLSMFAHLCVKSSWWRNTPSGGNTRGAVVWF